MGGDDLSAIITKVVLPKKPPRLVTRPRLLRRLSEYTDRKLTVISAPAGYGKTALLADYAHQTDIPVCWYSLDKGDRDPGLFLSYLVASLRHRFSAFSKEFGVLLGDTSKLDQQLDAVIGDLIRQIHDNVPSKFVLALDGYESVRDCQMIQNLLQALLRHLPPQAHLVIASRTPPGLDLTDLAAQQDVAELVTSDLAFTKEETEDLVIEKLGLTLSSEALDELVAETEGWVTGILLTNSITQRGSVEEMTRAKSKSTQIFAYLNREVFNPQPVEVQRFLKTTSVLKRMNPSLCDELPGIDNSQQFLDLLYENNLFVSKLEAEKEEYQYHHLFREFLKHKLLAEDAATYRDVNLGAAKIFERSGDHALAIEHYLQGRAFRPAADLIESTTGRVHRDILADWIDALPNDILLSKARLLIPRSRSRVERGDIAGAEQLCQEACRALRQEQDEEGLAAAMVSRGYILYHKGEYQAALADCREALSLLIDGNASKNAYQRWISTSDRAALHALGETCCAIIAEAHRTIGLCYGAQGRIAQAIRELERAKALFKQVGDSASVAGVQRDLGDLYTLKSELSEAEKYYEDAMEYWRGRQDIGALGSIIARLGTHEYLRGQYLQAMERFEEALGKVKEAGYPLEELRTLVSMADLQRDIGNVNRAQEQGQEALKIAQNTGARRLETYTLCTLARACHLAGERDRAQKLLSQAMEQSKESGSRYELALCKLIQGVMCYEDDDPTAALDYLSQAREIFKECGTRRELATAHLHLAQCLYLQAVRVHLEIVADLVTEIAQDQFVIIEGQKLLPLLEYAASQGIGNKYFADIRDRIALTSAEPTPKARVDAILQGVRAVKPMLKITALGPAQVWRDERLVTRPEWASAATKELFYLLLAHPEGLRKEQVIATLWSDVSGEKAQSVFHSTTHRLRRALWRDTVLYEDGRYRFNTGLDYWYDVEVFKSLLDQAQTASTAEERYGKYQAAVELYEGDYLEEFYSDWCYPLRDQLSSHFVNALMAQAEICAGDGRYEEAIELWRRVIEKDGYREDAYREIMKCHALMGDRASAIRYFKRCEQLLRDELDIPPMPETINLYNRILEGHLQ